MTEPSKDTYSLPSTREEDARLEAQAALYGGLAFLEPYLSHGTGRILDVGCGTGHFTRTVAARLPGAGVVGLERDGGRLAFAAEHGRAPNLRFASGDMHALPFDDGAFDLVFTRFVLVHDRDPVAALREQARVTRPGGRVVAYDMVHEGIWLVPDRPAFAAVIRSINTMLRALGAEPNQGLYLPSALARAGLDDVAFEVQAHAVRATDVDYERYRKNWSVTLAGLAAPLAPHVDAGVIEAAGRELDAVNGDELLVETTVRATGTKAR
ncbi:methyltransferase domain-containing protein [Myxococcota bacterium]|nr:methyltransferase domain-containing protein [Myxococcota bacterium]